MKRIVTLLIILIVAGAGIGGWFIYQNYSQNADVDAIKDMKPHISDNSGNSGSPDNVQTSLMDFTGLKSSNSDIIAWLTIPGTVIDYPVVQTDNNDFYLHHDAQKKTNSNGALFLDFRDPPDFSGFSNVIYGHHMKSERMFQNLMKFKDKAFFNQYKTGTLYTPGKTYTLEIFAVALTKPYSDWYAYSFESPAAKQAQLDMMKKTAMFYRDVGITADDHILVLSTCSYEYTNARTVVAAKLIDE